MKSFELPDRAEITRIWSNLTGFPAAVAVFPTVADGAEVLGRLSENDRRELSRMGSETRRRERLAGRRCELEVRDQLRDYGLVRTSISHSAGCAIAVGIGATTGKPGTVFPSVGVDIERADRSLKSGIAARILHVGEEVFGLGLIEAWVAKEACFKVRGTPGVLSDVRFRAFSPAENRGRAELGGQMIEFCLVRARGWVVGLAIGSRDKHGA